MAKVPRHRRPGRPTGLRGVTAGWWLAGELQVSPGQAVLLKAGGGWRRRTPRGRGRAVRRPGRSGQRDDGHPGRSPGARRWRPAGRPPGPWRPRRDSKPLPCSSAARDHSSAATRSWAASPAPRRSGPTADRGVAGQPDRLQQPPQRSGDVQLASRSVSHLRASSCHRNACSRCWVMACSPGPTSANPAPPRHRRPCGRPRRAAAQAPPPPLWPWIPGGSAQSRAPADRSTTQASRWSRPRGRLRRHTG